MLKYEDLDLALELIAHLRNSPNVWDICERFGAESGSGISAQCIYIPERSFVVKWAHGTRMDETPTGWTEDLIKPLSRIRPEDLAYFPDSIVEGNFIIQERVNVLRDIEHTLTDDDKFMMALRLVRIGIKYELGDMHHANIGFRPEDRHPVVFDIGHTSDMMQNTKKLVRSSGRATRRDIMNMIYSTHIWGDTYEQIADALEPEIMELI